MGSFIARDVVVADLPYSNFYQSKRRPVLILAGLPGIDQIACQITSQSTYDGYSIPLNNQDFSSGTLKKPSNIRPNKIFTIDDSIISYKVGEVDSQKMDDVVKRVCQIFSPTLTFI